MLTTRDAAWKGLYYAGAAAALLAVFLFRRNMGTELIAFSGFGVFNVPETWLVSALDWFTFLQQQKIMGLVLLGLVDLINYVLVGLIFLSLYGALRHINKSAMVAATVFAFVGIAVFLSTNQAFSMLALSNSYAAATKEAQKEMYLAAGEALLAIDNPGVLPQGPGYYIGLLLVIVSGLVISIVMLDSVAFKKRDAICGILANALILMSYPVQILAPDWAWVLPSLSALFRMAWYILIAIGLIRLARNISEVQDSAVQ